MGGLSKSLLYRLNPWERHPLPTVCDGSWAPGPVLAGLEIIAPTGFRSPDGYACILIKYYLFRTESVTVLLDSFTIQQQFPRRNIYIL